MKRQMRLKRVFEKCVWFVRVFVAAKPGSYLWIAVGLLFLTLNLVPAGSTQEWMHEFRLRMLSEINRARTSNGVPPVEIDEHACAVAQLHANDMADGEYFSHWDRDGLKPYMRYSLAGGYHALSENLSRTKGIPIERLHEAIVSSYLAEKPPNDGHRRTLLQRYATHVGIGIATGGMWTYVVQEFVTKLVKLYPLPQFATLDERLQIAGSVTDGWELHNIDVFYEPLPSPMAREELNRRGAYGLPDERKSLFKLLPPNARYADGSRGDIVVTDDGSFFSPLPFFANRPGVYTVVVWIKERNDKVYIPATTASVFVCRDKSGAENLRRQLSRYAELMPKGFLQGYK
ncbi:MAG: CAP domain-containing protein [Armatimonadota bacterium]|nr:CAP domain-containing protein [Armatimonadota bacterium]MCX7777652.1 CAP domain-containing protein [Armatimonadota bacterium]MDW8025898.1 CAP domain-containing protein [Armatimonadota bacterium]